MFGLPQNPKNLVVMSILNFVSQDELDDLDDDPRVAFMTLVDLAQRSLAKQSERLNPDQQWEWEQLHELRHSFMNAVIAAAKQFEVEPFLSMEVPRLDDNRGLTYQQFKADLDHYITQLVIENSTRAKRDSVAILPQSKDRIRSYVHALRECIENANMTPAKREALLEKLDQFEAELEKRRLNILAVTRLTFELLAIPGGLWASAEVVNKLINNVMQTVAEAKSAEQETRQLAPVAPPKALSPPRIEKSAPSAPCPRPTGIIDDEIPF
jgi:hypothetical protein